MTWATMAKKKITKKKPEEQFPTSPKQDEARSTDSPIDNSQQFNVEYDHATYQPLWFQPVGTQAYTNANDMSPRSKNLVHTGIIPNITPKGTVQTSVEAAQQSNVLLQPLQPVIGQQQQLMGQQLIM